MTASNCVKSEVELGGWRLVKRHLGRAPTGQHRVALQAHPRCVLVHEVKSDRTVARRYDHLIGPFRMHHDRLAARQTPIIDGIDLAQIVTAAGFAMGQRQLQIARDDVRDPVRVACSGQQPTGQKRAVEHGLDHACTPQFFEDQRDIEARATKTPVVLGEERAQNAKLGQP